MKRNGSPRTAVLAAAVVLFAIALNVAFAQYPAYAARPQPPLKTLSNRDLIDALDRASGTNPDRAMQIAELLRTRRHEMSLGELVTIIADTRRPRATREMMVDLLAGPPEQARVNDDVRKLLRDNRLDPVIKARVVASYEFGPEDAAMLGSLATGPHDAVAFHALKRLRRADPDSARRIALAAVSEPNRHSNSKLSAAYKVLIRSGVSESNPEVRSMLLGHLASVVRDKKADRQLKDSAAFALADMQSLDALQTLLESGADRVLLVGAVDQNALLIKTTLERRPDETTIALAVTAMELYPVREIAEPLYAARGKVKSPALLKRLNATVTSIQRDGVPLNTKWTED